MTQQTNPAPCLAVEGLEKSYSIRGGRFGRPAARKQALAGVSFSLGPGFYGLLGPGGAGKTTLVSLLTGSLKPDGGTVHWCGQSVRMPDSRFRRAAGCIPRQQSLYDSYTGRRFLSGLCALKEIPAREVPAQVERASEWLALSDELDKRLAAYSGGMKQRLLLAGALLGDPKLLLLDEPAAGLEPPERLQLQHLLARLAADRIVLVATSAASDVETADGILLLQDGRLVDQGPAEALIAAHAPGQDLTAVYRAVFGEEPGR